MAPAIRTAMLTTSARIICRAFRAPQGREKFRQEKTPFSAEMPQQFTGAVDEFARQGCANWATRSQFPRCRAFGYGAADACICPTRRAARSCDGCDLHPVAARDLESVPAARMGYRRLSGALVRRHAGAEPVDHVWAVPGRVRAAAVLAGRGAAGGRRGVD